jgi:hypothetical protein
MASGVRPFSTEDPDGHGAWDMPLPPLLLPLLMDVVDFGFVLDKYSFFTQRPLPW